VSSIRNATDGQRFFRNELRKFNEHHKPKIEQIRRKYSDNPLNRTPPELDDLLEAHVRRYLIDRLLISLNWNILPEDDFEATNLVPEAPVVSVAHGTTRYLDYLGMERGSDQALLIVESKRLGTPLPALKKRPARKAESLSDLDIVQSILAGLKGDELLHNWGEWLATLRDYFITVEQRGDSPPRRVVITDGNWCIVFREPKTTLLFPDRSTHDHISVYLPTGSEEIGAVFESNFIKVFEFLEYGCVLGQARSLTLGDLTFQVPPGRRTTMIRGLHLKYFEVEELYQTTPRIQISPLLFIRVEGGEWIRLEAREPEDVPADEDELVEHINSVQAKAKQFADAVTNALQAEPTWLSIEDHYLDPASFDQLKGVTETRQDEFILITGTDSHYLRKVPTAVGCPFHDWHKIGNKNHRHPAHAPLSIPSTEQRAFFIAPGLHHCAHHQVHVARSSQITEANRPHCGSRSGANHTAFCEIWPFERHLCCRTCIFEDVCTKASVFHLPCKRLSRVQKDSVPA
jgi:hypothetical protein